MSIKRSKKWRRSEVRAVGNVDKQIVIKRLISETTHAILYGRAWTGVANSGAGFHGPSFLILAHNALYRAWLSHTFNVFDGRAEPATDRNSDITAFWWLTELEPALWDHFIVRGVSINDWKKQQTSLKVLRDRHFYHIDRRGLDIKNVFQKAGVVPRRVQKLLNITARALEHLHLREFGYHSDLFEDLIVYRGHDANRIARWAESEGLTVSISARRT